jgi:hypothetical protein
MSTATVSEIPARRAQVEHDTFIDDLRNGERRPPVKADGAQPERR